MNYFLILGPAFGRIQNKTNTILAEDFFIGVHSGGVLFIVVLLVWGGVLFVFSCSSFLVIFLCDSVFKFLPIKESYVSDYL